VTSGFTVRCRIFPISSITPDDAGVAVRKIGVEKHKRLATKTAKFLIDSEFILNTPHLSQ
jgi:hypothetical protein